MQTFEECCQDSTTTALYTKDGQMSSGIMLAVPVVSANVDQDLQYSATQDTSGGQERNLGHNEPLMLAWHDQTQYHESIMEQLLF